MKYIYWASTGLISFMMVASATMYLLRTDEISAVFESLGFPAYLVLPLAVAKLLGVLAITTRRYPAIAEWAYAGFFYDFVLALTAHLNARDGEHLGAGVAIVLLATSYCTGRRVRAAE